MGHDRRLGEHHRGLLGGAGRLARVRLPAAGRRRASARQPSGAPLAAGHVSEPIPLARPELGAREEELVAGGAALGPALAGADGGALRARVRRLARGRGRGRRLQRDRGAAPRRAGARLGRGRRGPDQPASASSPRPTACSTRGRGRSSATSTRRRSTSTRPPPRRRSASAPPGILPVHIFGYPAAMAELEALADRHGLGILEDACEALGAVDAEGRRVGTRGNLATFAFYANKQMTTGEGGMVVPSDAGDRRAPALASATRAAPPTWAGSTTSGLGFNYRLSDVAAAIGVAQVERLDALLERARRGRRPATPSGWPAIEGVEAPIAGRGAERRSWFVYAVSPAGRGRPRRGDRPPRRARASPARPTCPASTSSRTCASSATARASSRSPRRPRPARWRCPSSRR